jgi:hypothetical protein
MKQRAADVVGDEPDVAVSLGTRLSDHDWQVRNFNNP